MDRKYDELVQGRIYFGGAADTDAAVAQQKIDVVVDVRVNGRNEAGAYQYIHSPIADENDEIPQSIKAGVEQVVDAYKEGKNIYIHCGSGSGRAGVMSVATLLELGIAENLTDAEAKVKEARPIVNVRPKMKEALEKLYK